MNFKELLIAQGVTEEQANKIVESMPANKLYISSEENLDIRYKKTKEDLEQVKSDLANANKLVDDLKKTNVDAEALQKKVSEYEDNIKKIEGERAQERKSYAIKEALTKNGATDMEYLAFKLGDVELDKDGTIKDLDNKIKSLKEAHPTFFPAPPADPGKDQNKGGYKTIDNKLPKGNDPGPSEPKSLAEAIKLQYTTKEGN